MTNKDNNSKSVAAHKKLLRSVQELNLTLESLKALNAHLKDQRRLFDPTLDDTKPLDIVKDCDIDAYTRLH